MDHGRRDRSIRSQGYDGWIPVQRYVSRELSHFVGRSLLERDEEQYELLLTILRSGELLTPDQNLGWSYRFDAPLFSEGEERYTQSVICFCDIPEPDLTLHMKTYGLFGLAFTKEFLTQRGARPVYYVSTTTSGLGAGPPGGDHTVKHALNDLVARLGRVERALREGSLLDPTNPHFRDLEMVLDSLLEEQCLTFIKAFDPGASDEDAENVYMEREWRIKHNRLGFTLADVHRVFLPASFGPRLRKDVPNYNNQVSFVDP